jgi:acyl carrier protein
MKRPDQTVITVDDAVEAVKRVLSRKSVDGIDLQPDTRFEDLGLDSLDAADLCITLEEIAGRPLDVSSLSEAATIADLAAVRAE